MVTTPPFINLISMDKNLKKTEKFIKEAIKIHGDKFDYSKVEYIKSSKKIKIICKNHGVFESTPTLHKRSKYSCPKCTYIGVIKSRQEKILKNKFSNLIQPVDYKIIPLNKYKKVKVDNDDFDRLKNIIWSYSSIGYASNKKYGFMHRFIMNYPDNKLIDHINHDTLDNRKANLRTCNKFENQRHQRTKTGTSKYKGVSWDKNRNKWTANIMSDYKEKKIGRFDSEIEAAKAYDEKAKELHGEFAFTNF